jgi:predicted nucleic acid-binding protein
LTGKKPISDNSAFIDSNVFLYLLDKKDDRKQIARVLLDNRPVISTQVISENINIAVKKFKLGPEQAFQHAENLAGGCDVKLISVSTIRTGCGIHHKYKYSFYDSLIIASALENDCSILYSEDMQHNQLIEKKLRIVNPFVK